MTIWDSTDIHFIQVKLQEKEKQHELTLADLHRQKEELLRKHTALATELDQRKEQSKELESALHEWGKHPFSVIFRFHGTGPVLGTVQRAGVSTASVG